MTQTQPLVISVSQTAKLLDMGESQVRIFLRAGKIQGVKLGKQWRVNRESVYKLVGQPLAGDTEAN